MEKLRKLSEEILRKEEDLAKTEVLIKKLQKEKSLEEEIIKERELVALSRVVFDKELKNENQRKVKVKEILDNDNLYQSAQEEIENVEKHLLTLYEEKAKQKAKIEHLKRLYEIEMFAIKNTVEA